MKVSFTPSADEDLEAILAYLEPRNPRASDKTLAAILTTAKLLQDFPLIGHEGRVHGTREFVVPGTPFILIYEIYSGTDLWVLRVLHGAEEFPPAGRS